MISGDVADLMTWVIHVAIYLPHSAGFSLLLSLRRHHMPPSSLSSRIVRCRVHTFAQSSNLCMPMLS